MERWFPALLRSVSAMFARSLVPFVLLFVSAGIAGCVGSGVDVPSEHPANVAAPIASLPPVGGMLSSDEATPPPAPADPHAHHHHHGAPE